MTTTEGDKSGSQSQADQGNAYRQLIIDFLCLGLDTSEPCVTTEEALDKALDALGPVFNLLRIVPNVNRVNITQRELAEQHCLVSSPTIRVDGVEICTEFIHEGHDHDQPLAGMIVDGILKVLYSK